MRGALLLASLALLPAILAGCASPSDPVTAASKEEASATSALSNLSLDKALELAIPLTDGVLLHGTVYLPKLPSGDKMPVLVDMGPYYGNLGPDTQASTDATAPRGLYTHFLQRGYAIAFVSVRGTGQSGGCFKVGGPEERQDVAAMVEWLAKQPWSDGNVAMTGVSYDGSTPWEGLAAAPPHLKAIIPVEGISDFYRYSFFEGVPVNTGPLFNTYYKALVDYAYASPTSAPAWGAAQPSAACSDQSDVFASPYQTYADGVHSAYWDARDSTAFLKEAKAATYAVQGFQDYNVRLDDVQYVWDQLPEPKRMLLGQWQHNIPWSNSFDHKLDYVEYNQTVDDWLDAHLRNDTAAQERLAKTGPVVVQDSTGGMWNLTRWPPAESRDTPFFLTSDQKLADAPGSAGSVALRANPATAVASGVAPVQVPVSSVAFRGEPAKNATRIFGNPWANLTVSSDQPRGLVSLFLYDQDEAGKEFFLTEGFQNLATRTDRHQAESVPTNAPMTLHVKMYALAHVLKPGHRLVLYVSPEAQDATLPMPQAGTITLQTGGEHPASLELPLFTPPGGTL